MIKVGNLFKQVDIIKFWIHDYFLCFFLSCNCHTSMSSVCKINDCISESYNNDMQPNLEAQILFRADGLFQYRDVIGTG